MEDYSNYPLNGCIEIDTYNREDSSMQPGISLGVEQPEQMAVCPCGWGPNGTPPADTYGVYQSTPTVYNSFNTHPTCGTLKGLFGPTPLVECFQEYLTMPFCINQATGVHTMGWIAMAGVGGYASCLSDVQLAALSNQDRIDIFNNTMNVYDGVMGVHSNGYAVIPVIKMNQWGAVTSSGVWYAPYLYTVNIKSNGHLDIYSCGYKYLSCPNTCHGCTAVTATNCASNPTACEEYDPIASNLFYLPSVTVDNCCVNGCTDQSYVQYNPLANCDDGSCMLVTHLFTDCTGTLPGGSIGVTWNGLTGYVLNGTSFDDANNSQLFYNFLNSPNIGQVVNVSMSTQSGADITFCLQYDGTTNQVVPVGPLNSPIVVVSTHNNCNDCVPSWDCINPGNCQDPGTGLGQYSTLALCNADCPFLDSWNCLGPGNCQDPNNGSGQYTTLQACNVACPALSWNCTSPGNCQDPNNGTGMYTTLNACNTACPPLPPVSWDCTNPGTSSNCHDPGNGLGQYTTLTACQNDCIDPAVVVPGACGCNF